MLFASSCFGNANRLPMNMTIRSTTCLQGRCGWQRHYSDIIGNGMWNSQLLANTQTLLLQVLYVVTWWITRTSSLTLVDRHLRRPEPSRWEWDWHDSRVSFDYLMALTVGDSLV